MFQHRAAAPLARKNTSRQKDSQSMSALRMASLSPASFRRRQILLRISRKQRKKVVKFLFPERKCGGIVDQRRASPGIHR